MWCRVLFLLVSTFLPFIYGFLQADESLYLTNFPNIISKSYTQPLPASLLSSTCKQSVPITNTIITLPVGNINAATAQAKCGTSSTCVVPEGATLTMDGSLVVGALLNYGTITWTSSTQTSPAQWLCAGYVVTDGGTFTLNIPDWTKQAIIYIKNNGAVHTSLRTRVFGGLNRATLTVNGSPMTRTWSLLSRPVSQGATSITLMHDVTAMGWHVGDRIVIASTKPGSQGTADVFTIASISGNSINLASAFPTNSISTTQSFMASQSIIESAWIASQSAEVMDMTRNVWITGDDLQHKGCVGPMLYTSGYGSVPGIDPGQDCTCINPRQASYYRSTCTLGLHTIASGIGTTLNMQYTKIEKCGQRGILGKYCIHLHEVGYCPTCLIRGNSIEYGHHRGITIHGSHASTVLENVLSDVRGANIYIEDGNEMHNQIRHNVAVCPWPHRDPMMHGCTIPGTDEDQADTELNQSGLWGVSFTNDVVGNRFANSYNGMLYQSQGFEHGRHDTEQRECAINQQIGRLEGNTFHSHGRFGTYLLETIYPKQIDRTVANDGLVPLPTTDSKGNSFWPSCAAYTADGIDRGRMFSLVRNIDYGNGFVGQYNLGDIQYTQHTSIGNEQAIYWKEVKNPADGCAPAVINSYFYGVPYQGYANMALPGGHGTVVLENIVMGGWITFESGHHCGVGLTGVLCMSTYVFVNPNTDAITSFKYEWGANNGAMWNLSPDDGMNPTGQMFPAGYISLANPYWSYLLAIDGGKSCISSLSPTITTPMMSTYGSGILCKRPLRRLEVYTPKLTAAMGPPQLRLELWQNNQMISFVLVPFWQIDQGQTGKNGYAMTVIPGLDHSYRLMRADFGPIPSDWVIEFSDPIFGNRWARDEIYLQVTGRTCPSIVHSLHDRKFTWYDSHNHPFTPGRGACTTQPDMTPVNCKAVVPPPNGMSCPEKCPGGCNNGYCDCGRGVCQCEAGFSGPNCAIDSCAASGCDPIMGRCSTRYLGGTLQPVEGACVCRNGAYGPKCNINPCSGQTCSGHGTCQALSQTSIRCACADGWGGNSCSSPCPGSVNGYLMYANSALQSNIYYRAPAVSATDCRDQCSADPKCLASSFYNSNYCALMSSLTGMILPSSTNTMLQINAAAIVLFVKCNVPNDIPLIPSTGGFIVQPTGAPTKAPSIAPTTSTPTIVSKPTVSTPTDTAQSDSPATTPPLQSGGPTCINGFITYTGATYDLMGLPYTSTPTAAGCLALCAAQDPTTCAAAVWYNYNACVRYTATQAQGKTLSPSPDPKLPRTTFVRCTATATQAPTAAPTTKPPTISAPTTPATQSPFTPTTAPTSAATTPPLTSTGPPCINGFQMYADTTWDLMGLPYVIATTAQACANACNTLGTTCAAAVWYNFNACVGYTQAQTVGQVMKKSPDPNLPRTLIVRCTTPVATAAPTPGPATTTPTTGQTTAPATRTPTTAPTTAPVQTTPTTAPTTLPGEPACIAGFQTYSDSTYNDLGGLPYTIAYTAANCLQQCSSKDANTCAGAVWYNYNACVLFNAQQVIGKTIVKSPDPKLPRTTFVRCGIAAIPSTPKPTPTPTPTPDLLTPCSNILCTLPTCTNNATRVLGLLANPIQGICCDLYSCQSITSSKAASSINVGANVEDVDMVSPDTTAPSTSISSSKPLILGITVGLGIILCITIVLIYRHMRNQRATKTKPHHIKISTDEHDDDAHERESHDKVPPMIPFNSPISSDFNPSPSPVSSLGLSPVLRGLAGSPTQAPALTPLSSISLDSPSPHHQGSMSHRHPLRPSTSATSLLTADPRVQVMNTRQMHFQQEGEQQKP